MRFPTLFKKELRETAPWLILAVLLLSTLGWFMIHMKAYDQAKWWYGPFSKGKVIDSYMLPRTDIMLESAVLMFFTSIGLGLSVGIRHFWVPGFTRTWQFLIHRSATRSVILSAKLIAAATVLLCLSIVWLLLAGYTYISDTIIIPPDPGLVNLGIFYTYLGFIVYLGTALCALTTARWYTTRMFGLFFVFIMFLIVLSQTNFTFAFILTVFFLTVLIIQVYEAFLQKEF